MRTGLYGRLRQISYTPPPPVVAPGQVTGLAAGAPGETSVPLSWAQPAGTAPLTYRLEFKRTADAAWSVAAAANTSLSYTVTGLLAGTAYQFRVRAENAVGVGSYSNVVSATTDQATSTAALVASNPSYWTLGSPAPTATKTGQVVSLSGRFNGTNVSGSGLQQTVGQVPTGYRPLIDVEGQFATFYSNAGANLGRVTVAIQNNGVIRLTSFAPASSGYILFDAAMTYNAS